ncbi:hypothetical protein [Eisenbergiella sp.]
MMNLPFLYWASEETGDPRFSQIAANYADMAMKAFIRGDFSIIYGDYFFLEALMKLTDKELFIW